MWLNTITLIITAYIIYWIVSLVLLYALYIVYMSRIIKTLKPNDFIVLKLKIHIVQEYHYSLKRFWHV